MKHHQVKEGGAGLDPLQKLKEQAAQIEDEALRRQMLVEIEREAAMLASYSIFVQMAWYNYTKFLLAGELKDNRIVAIVIVLQCGSTPPALNGAVHDTLIVHILNPPVDMERELRKLAEALDAELKSDRIPARVLGLLITRHQETDVVREIAAGRQPPDWQIIYDRILQLPGQGGPDANDRRAN